MSEENDKELTPQEALQKNKDFYERVIIPSLKQWEDEYNSYRSILPTVVLQGDVESRKIIFGEIKRLGIARSIEVLREAL